jgi:DNA modification methylase
VISPELFTRHERIGDCDLYQADCLPILAALQQEGGGGKPLFDAVVTDPPYGVNQDRGFGLGGVGFGGRRAGMVKRYAGGWDADRPAPEVFAALLDVADSFIIWGGQYFADLLPAQGKWLWWDKCQTMPSFGDGELAWTNLPGQAPKKLVYSNNGLMAREKDRQHPTQKPIAVMEWCLSFLPDARRIFDPFMGSGTTGVACVKTGRAFVGIERDPGYFEIACKRIADAHRQADLFVAKPDITKPTQDSFL